METITINSTFYDSSTYAQSDEVDCKRKGAPVLALNHMIDL